MSATPNLYRGEDSLHIAGQTYLLRPTFSALIAAEDELGSLFSLLERASKGELRLNEMASLLWHCLVGREHLRPEDVGKAIAEQGMAAASKPLRSVLGQILQGQG